MTTATPSRDSFVARFGEDQAAAIETAARLAYFDEHAELRRRGHRGPHADDDFGSDSFRYWFLYAIAFMFLTDPALRARHGITAPIDQMQEWARGEGDLAGHDGDLPSYLAWLYGAYAGWVEPGKLRPWRAVCR